MAEAATEGFRSATPIEGQTTEAFLSFPKGGTMPEKPLEKPLEPPPPYYSPWTPRDPNIAHVRNIRPLVDPELAGFEACANPSERLLRLLELADEKGSLFANAILTRPI